MRFLSTFPVKLSLPDAVINLSHSHPVINDTFPLGNFDCTPSFFVIHGENLVIPNARNFNASSLRNSLI